MDHIVVTTSGMNYRAPLGLCLDVLGPDRVLFAADHPYESNHDAVDGIESAGLDRAVMEKVFHANGERVFGLPSQ